MKSRHFADKMSPKSVSRAYGILLSIHRGYLTQKDFERTTNSTNRQVRRILGILYEEGYITLKNPMVNKWKKYNLTMAGKTAIARLRSGEDYEQNYKNEKIVAKFENPNIENIKKMLESSLYVFKTNPKMRHIERYDGKIEGHSIEINIGKERSSFIIKAPMYYKKSPSEAGWFAHKGINEITYNLNKKWNLGLQVPKYSDEEHFSKHTDFADAIMEITQGKGIKVGEYMVNASPPFFIADEEHKDPIKLKNIVDTHIVLPEKFRNIDESLEKMKHDMNSTHSEQIVANYNLEKLTGIVGMVADNMASFTETQKETSTQISRLVEEMTKMATSVSEIGKAMIPKPADTIPTQADFRKDDVLGSMFG